MTEKKPGDLNKQRKLAYALNMHYVAHFIRCYKAFNGDVESCIILGEISHYNTKSIVGLFDQQSVEKDEAQKLLKACVSQVEAGHGRYGRCISRIVLQQLRVGE